MNLSTEDKNGEMNAVKEKISNCATSKGADVTGMGRWNYVGIANGAKNCDSCLHANFHDQKNHLAQCMFRDDDL